MCSSIHAGEKKIAFGTVDGMLIFTDFAISYNGVKIEKPVQTKLQKKSTHHSSLMGQMNSVDISCKDRKHFFCFYSGSEETGMFEITKNKKIKNITTANSVTAVKVSPDSDFLLYACGSDWLKGLDELNDAKKAKLVGVKLTSSDFY